MKKNLSTSLSNLQVIILVLFSMYAGFIFVEILHAYSNVVSFALFYLCICINYGKVFRLNEKPKNLFIDYIDLISLLVTIWVFSYIITKKWADFINISKKDDSFMFIYFLALIYFIILIIRKIIKIFKHKKDLSNSDTDMNQARDFSGGHKL